MAALLALRRAAAWACAAALCAVLCAPAACAQVYDDAPPHAQWQRCPLLRVVALPTGQSDCLLLQCGGQNMLVDGGFAACGEDVAAALQARGVTQLKYMFNTHYHEDHIGGLQTLLRAGYPTQEYLHPHSDAAESAIDRHRLTLQAARGAGVAVRRVQSGDVLLLGEAALTLYAWQDGPTVNARSMMARVTFGDASMLLTADIIGATQDYLVENSPFSLDVDILKAPHHGVTPMSAGFLEAASPACVLITDSEENVTTAKPQLQSRGIPAFYSGDGAVVFETDGKDWYVYQEGSDRP